jgi:hypothetical protein
MRVKGHGQFLLFASERPVAVRVDGWGVDGWRYEEGELALRFDIPFSDQAGMVHDVDVEFRS